MFFDHFYLHYSTICDRSVRLALVDNKYRMKESNSMLESSAISIFSPTPLFCECIERKRCRLLERHHWSSDSMSYVVVSCRHEYHLNTTWRLVLDVSWLMVPLLHSVASVVTCQQGFCLSSSCKFTRFQVVNGIRMWVISLFISPNWNERKIWWNVRLLFSRHYCSLFCQSKSRSWTTICFINCWLYSCINNDVDKLSHYCISQLQQKCHVHYVQIFSFMLNLICQHFSA